MPETVQAKNNRPAPPNGPAQTGNKSGGGRGNNPPCPKIRPDGLPEDIGGYVKKGGW